MQPDGSHQSAFRTPEQLDLYRRLTLFLGPGPAAYYRDACRLLVIEPPFDATTHLVMHMMREIECMIRDVLVPLAKHNMQATGKSAELKKQGKEAEEKKTKHALEIHLSCEYLGVVATDPLAQAWLNRASSGGSENPDALHKRAHRDNLAAPRPVDDEFLTYFEETERLFGDILHRFEPKYSAAIEVVDELVAKTNPTPGDARLLRRNVPNTPVLLSRFFNAIENPAWLPHLQAEDFFAHPPGPQRDADTGEIAGYFPWPASRYLVRVAQKGTADPAVLIEIVRGIIDTPNPHVREDILDVLLALPADEVADLIPRVVSWIEGP